MDSLRRFFNPAPAMADPALRFAWLARRGARRLDGVFPFADPSLHYAFSGTAALSQAARALRLRAGDHVLLPAYNCGHEVEPFLRLGLRVGFYPVGRALRIDAAAVEDALEPGTRAVLVTHYFGFPQDLGALRALCAHRGLMLIEDCAHALFSRSAAGPIGAGADAAVFSLRKSLPLPHGGAWTTAACDGVAAAVAPPRGSTSRSLARQLRKSLLSGPGYFAPRLGLLALSPAFAGMELAAKARVGGRLSWFDPDGEQYDFAGETLDWRMAGVCHRILAHVEPGSVVARRRDNFRYLLERLAGSFELLHDRLPDGVCPLLFPLIVYNRDETVDQLSKRGVSAIAWWGGFHPAVPWSRHPEAVFLKDHVLALPVHQDIAPAALQTLADACEGIRPARRGRPL